MYRTGVAEVAFADGVVWEQQDIGTTVTAIRKRTDDTDLGMAVARLVD